MERTVRKINKDWHLANKMPNPPVGGPTLDERIAWHLAHAKHCSCRPLSGKILEEIKKRGLVDQAVRLDPIEVLRYEENRFLFDFFTEIFLF